MPAAATDEEQREADARRALAIYRRASVQAAVGAGAAAFLLTFIPSNIGPGAPVDQSLAALGFAFVVAGLLSAIACFGVIVVLTRESRGLGRGVSELPIVALASLGTLAASGYLFFRGNPLGEGGLAAFFLTASAAPLALVLWSLAFIRSKPRWHPLPVALAVPGLLMPLFFWLASAGNADAGGYAGVALGLARALGVSDLRWVLVLPLLLVYLVQAATCLAIRLSPIKAEVLAPAAQEWEEGAGAAPAFPHPGDDGWIPHGGGKGGV